METRWRGAGWERVMVVALLMLALLACKKKREPDTTPTIQTVSPTALRANELKPKVKARIDKLAGIATKAKSEPKVKKERPFKPKLEKDKFIVLGDKWLEDVHYEPTAEEIDLDNTTLSLCEYALKDATSTDDQVGYMETCLQWEYVAVVRPKKITLPVIKMQTKSFDPGLLEGDLLLFDLASGDIVGRYVLRITNSDTLSWFEGTPEKEWQDKSKRDLVENVRGVIEERLQLERDTTG